MQTFRCTACLSVYSSIYLYIYPNIYSILKHSKYHFKHACTAVFFLYPGKPPNLGNTRAGTSQFGIKTTQLFRTNPGLVERFCFLLPELINNRTAELSRSSGKIQPVVLIKGRHKQLTLHPANCYQTCQNPDWDC